MEPKWNQIGTGSILEHSGSTFAHFGQKFDSRSRGVAKCILMKFSSAVLEHVFKLFEVVLKPFVFQYQIDLNLRVRLLRLVGLGSRLVSIGADSRPQAHFRDSRSRGVANSIFVKIK